MSQKILVAEDDAAVRSLYTFLLTNNGYGVIEAVDGKDALEKFLKTPCQMVITDMNMPRMGGMQFVEEVRRHNQDTYIIMITAFGTTNTKQEALSRGVNEYMSKPFELQDLLVRVRNYFERKVPST